MLKMEEITEWLTLENEGDEVRWCVDINIADPNMQKVFDI